MKGRIFSLNVSTVKGQPKGMVPVARFIAGQGIEGDAHAGPGRRQVSLLAVEDVEALEARLKDADVDLRPGIFAENITTEDFDLSKVKAGDQVRIGSSILLTVTQIGKECHGACAIKTKVGECVMPERGVFAVVEQGGEARLRDSIEIVKASGGAFSWLKR
jgi:MOSC domain-containing protein YiiM